MVRAMEHSHSVLKSRSFQLKRMFEIPAKHNGNDGERSLENQKRRSALTHQISCCMSLAPAPLPSTRNQHPSDMELMKEKFSKLLLGEDMSGGGKGVSSALALSNAITNLAASIFGEQRKLEPMPPERKARWKREISWFLAVTDHIVEFVPSQQKTKDGVNMEIMVTRQRNDLHMDIPALRKLDAMLIDCLDSFGHQNEFWYLSGDAKESEGENTQRHDDKWWIPTAKVPSNGLSDVARKLLQSQKESVNQVLKATMAINAQVLSEMEIPESYIESLPKNGRASLGDLIYKSITVEYFDPEQFLSAIDMSTEHLVLDLKNRIEASIVIWKRKMNLKDGKSSWGSAVSLEKRELFEERAETILLLLKHRFPGTSQSALDISKIQYNKDVGQAILESYSRIIESLAFTVMSRIDDVLYADSLAQTSSLLADSNEKPPTDSPESPIETCSEEMDNYKHQSETPNSKTLSDFMGWEVVDQEEETNIRKNHSTGNIEIYYKGENDKLLPKTPKALNLKKLSYLEKLENLSGLRSPTAGHWN